VSGRGFFRETSARFVPNDQVPAGLIPPGGLVGPVYEFTATDSGNPLAVHDSSGRLVLADRGSITFRALFDTLGDHQPGAVELSSEVVKVVGSFPLLDVDLCDLAVDLVG
jgi:hypothetical protein